MDPITLGAGIALAGSSILGYVRRRQRLQVQAEPPKQVQAEPPKQVQAEPPKQAQAEPPKQAQAKNEIVAPAYPALVAAPIEVRQALLDVAISLGISPAALATVIQSESRWDPTEPKDPKPGVRPKGTPRAGLIQLTQGANLREFTDKERIWALRAMPAEQQLRLVVLPYFARMNLSRVKTADDPALELYKRNFLPGDAGKNESYPLGKKGSKELLHPRYPITRGDVYDANPVFHGNGARPQFTWAEVSNKVRSTEKEARGKWVTLSGQLVDPPPAADKLKELETKSDTKTIVVPADAGKLGPTMNAPCAPAPSLRALLREIDAAFPARMRASDGLCGDVAHQARESDHNAGNAIDVSVDKVNGPDLDALATVLLKDRRTKYVIWNQRIATPAIDNGKWRDYPSDPSKKGKVNPHTRHLHLSIHAAARADVSSWQIAQLTPTRGDTDETDKLLIDPVAAWRAGKVDPIQWVPLRIGEYEIYVAADCLAVKGVRLPVSFANVKDICKGAGILPNTKAVVDARWNLGEKRIVLRTRPPNNHGPDATLVREVKEWSAKMGPTSRTLLAGPWKEWVLDDVKKPGDATNYGLWGPNLKPIQTLGHRHSDIHVDDSQMFAPVRRTALRNGRTVDLLEELSKGCPLGGPVPAWLVQRLQ